MAQYFLHTLDVCAILKEQRRACMPQIVRRNALQADSPHEMRDLARRRVRIAGLVGTLKPLKEIHVLDDLVGMPLYRGSLEQKKFVFDAFHDRNGTDAARRLRLRDKDAALLGVRHIAGDMERVFVEVEVLPLQAKTFSAPDSRRCHEQHHASVFGLAFADRTEEDSRLILRERIHWALDRSRRVHLLDRILLDELLLFRVVEDDPQDVVMMLDALLRKRPSVRGVILVTQILQVSHDVDGRYVPESFVSKLGQGHTHHESVHGNSRWPQTARNDFQRQPDLLREVSEGFLFGDFLRHLQSFARDRRRCRELTVLWLISFDLLLPAIGFSLCQLAGFGVTQAVWRFPRRRFVLLFTLIVLANVGRKLERHDLSILLFFSDG